MDLPTIGIPGCTREATYGLLDLGVELGRIAPGNRGKIVRVWKPANFPACFLAARAFYSGNVSAMKFSPIIRIPVTIGFQPGNERVTRTFGRRSRGLVGRVAAAANPD